MSRRSHSPAAGALLPRCSATSRARAAKTGVAGGRWTVVQASGVSAIALAEGTTSPSGLIGYLSNNGTFFAEEASPQAQWTKQASKVTAISLAAVGPSGEPLLGYLAGSSFYAAESLTPATWVQEATGVAQMAVASGSAPGALPVLGYVTTAGDLEVMQGQLCRPFSRQARGASSLALSSVTDS